MIVRKAEGPHASAACGVAVMAKASEPGRTKTRLAPPLTLGEAARFNTAFLKDVAANLASAAERVPLAGYMAFGPPGAAPFFEAEMPAAIGLVETWFPNFGDCLWHAAETLFELGHEAACVLNSDSPTLPAEILVDMAQALARPGDRAVLGPSTDGGYYVLGLKARHRRMFDDIAWSTDTVADQTRERAAEIGLDLIELPVWYDVDDAGSLRTVAGECLFGRPFSEAFPPSPAHATAAELERLFASTDLARRLGLADDVAWLEGLRA